MNMITKIKELEKRIELLEIKNGTSLDQNIIASELLSVQLSRLLNSPYDPYSENIYHRTCAQLKDFLRENGFPVYSLSRSAVGGISYYNLEFNLSDRKVAVEISDLDIADCLGIEKIGLVDYHEKNGEYHLVYLIDEEELNNKYLKNGNLKFQTKTFKY